MAGEGQGRGLLIAGGILLVLGIAGIGIGFGLFISPASQVQDEIEALKSQLSKKEENKGSEVCADQTGPSGLEQIVSSKSWSCPDGSDSSVNCRYFLARNILSLDVDRGGVGDSMTNYWLAEQKTVEDQGFVMSLGRSSTIWGVTLRNIHNSWAHDRATKKFKVLGGSTANGPWEELLVADLEDSRRQNPPPVQQLMFANPAVVSFIKFELLEYWGNGGGLQYFVPIYSAK